MPALAVTTVGADRPGIIAAVTTALAAEGGNLLDSTMTVLGGHFAILLLVETDRAPGELEETLAAATAGLGLVVAVREVGAGAVTPPPTHVLSVYGADRTGLVAAVSAVLAEAGVNVTDLSTSVLDGSHAVYAMVFEVALPQGVDAGALAAGLVHEVRDVDVSLRPLETGPF